MYRFALSPRWLVSHALIALLLIAMLIAGLWQLDRLSEKKTRNASIVERTEVGAQPLEQVLSPGATANEDLQFVPVTVMGEYRPEDEVLIRNRSLNSSPGSHVLTPLVLADGRAIAVNRGWVPLSFAADEARPGTEPPAGLVTVTGWLQPTVVAEGFQRDDPAEGRLTSLARVDLDRFRQQLDYELAPVWLQLDGEATSTADVPVPLDLPVLDNGPHLSYAVQWFTFATIAIVGYPLILRRAARSRQAEVERELG